MSKLLFQYHTNCIHLGSIDVSSDPQPRSKPTIGNPTLIKKICSKNSCIYALNIIESFIKDDKEICNVKVFSEKDVLIYSSPIYSFPFHFPKRVIPTMSMSWTYGVIN